MSRFQWADEHNGSKSRDMFKKYIDTNPEYLLMPIGLKNNQQPTSMNDFIINFDYAIKMEHVSFKTGTSIKDDDILKSVLQSPTKL